MNYCNLPQEKVGRDLKIVRYSYLFESSVCVFTIIFTVAHKSLFSKYSRNCTPNLRTNLFVSRINFDDSILLNSTNEKPSTNMRFVTPKVDQLYKRSVGKYSRLFTTYKNNTKGLCNQRPRFELCRVLLCTVTSINLKLFIQQAAVWCLYRLMREPTPLSQRERYPICRISIWTLQLRASSI